MILVLTFTEFYSFLSSALSFLYLFLFSLSISLLFSPAHTRSIANVPPYFITIFRIIFQSRLYFLHSFSVSPLFSPSTIFFDSLFPLFFLFSVSPPFRRFYFSAFLIFSSLHYFSFKGFPLDMFLMFWAFHLSEYLKVHIFLGIQSCGNISPRKC